jgi:predicted nucleic acid-binding protein
VYLDSAYIAKHYLNEADSPRVRAVLNRAEKLVSSMWALAEVSCAIQRKFREGILRADERDRLLHTFLEHVESGSWVLVPVSERLLRRMSLHLSALPRETYIRTGDAIHLTTALDLGEPEIWSNDRHVLTAAPHFGLTGRSV